MAKTYVHPRLRQRPGTPGTGIDTYGNPVVDPTENVISLSEAGNKRQDDLRALTKELFDAKVEHLKELATLNSKHQRELDVAESERLDSIRQVDREDVNKTAAQALNAIQTLATTTSTTAETLRTQVATTALASQNQLATITGEINKRLSALELSSSERQGKQTVSDPQMEKLTALVELLARNQATGAGKSEGMSDTAKMLIAGLSVLVMLLGIGGVGVTLVVFLNRVQEAPAAAYVPAPYGTQVPSTVPGSIPPGTR